MSKLDWSKANRFECDPGTVTTLNEYEAPPKQRQSSRARLSPTEMQALLDRSEEIRLKAVAKKKERLAKLASGDVSRWKE